MAKNRVSFTTTIDKDILRKTRIKAAELGLSGANDVIEMALNTTMADQIEKNPIDEIARMNRAVMSANVTATPEQVIEMSKTYLSGGGTVGTKNASTEKTKNFNQEG